MKHLLSILLTVFCSFSSLAQDDSWMTYDGEAQKDSMRLQDTAVIEILNFDAPDGTITIQKDPRVQSLIDFMGTPKAPDPVLIKGFRVQIAFSQNKAEAHQQKMRFQTIYSEYAAYTNYLAPNFRIRVGNFKSRLEAEKLQSEILAEFPSAIVVNDLIELPQLDQCEGIQTDTTDDDQN